MPHEIAPIRGSRAGPDPRSQYIGSQLGDRVNEKLEARGRSEPDHRLHSGRSPGDDRDGCCAAERGRPRDWYRSRDRLVRSRACVVGDGNAMSAVDITTHTRLEWADRVQGLMVRANRDVGRELCAAKGDLPHGEFTVMVEQDLGRSLRWAEMLMSIAQHPIIGESKHASVLPADTTSLYGLSRLEPDTVEFYLAAGDLTRTSTRVEVRELC